MSFSVQSNSSKEIVFLEVEKYLKQNGLHYSSKDEERPWGGFFVIDKTDTEKFIELYFSNYPIEQIKKYGIELSPKILIVEPHKRLSWQYHNRRAEL